MNSFRYLKLFRSTALATAFSIGSSGAGMAAVIQYSDYSDFVGVPTITETGASIYSSGSYTTNSSYGSNGINPGAGASSVLSFSGLSNTEVGMIFGNDEAVFTATLEIFSGASSLGSVSVLSNGNDAEDQFIGLGSDTTFDSVTLSYGAGGEGLTVFIDEIQFGDGLVSVPELDATGSLAAIASLLALMAFLWERRRHQPEGEDTALAA